MANIQTYVTMPPLETETFFTLVDTIAQLIGASEKYWHEKGLNGARIRLLVEIAKAGGTIFPSELAERIGVTRANISVLLIPLEKEGFIVSADHPEDGRKRRIVLAEKGESLLWEMLPDNRKVIAEQMKGLTEGEMRELLRLMYKLREGME